MSGPAAFTRNRRPSSYMFRVLVKTGLDELLERPAEVALQLRRRVLGDEEERPHRVEVGEGGLALGQLNSSDAQRPDVRLKRKIFAIIV